MIVESSELKGFKLFFSLLDVSKRDEGFEVHPIVAGVKVQSQPVIYQFQLAIGLNAISLGAGVLTHVL